MTCAFTAIAARPKGSTSLATTRSAPASARGDRDQAAARAQVEHRPPGDRAGVVEHVPRERLTARARRPPRTADPSVRTPRSSSMRLPQRDDVVGHVQVDLGDQRRRARPGVRADEGWGPAGWRAPAQSTSRAARTAGRARQLHAGLDTMPKRYSTHR